MHARFATSLALVLFATPALHADCGLSVLPPWEAAPAKAFATRDGALWADGRPMPLFYDFTWSAPHDAEFFHFLAQYRGNAHFEGISYRVEPESSYALIDRIYADAAKARIYCSLGLNVQHLGYADNDSYARTAEGEIAHNGTRSFLHTGYRDALAAKLTELAGHVKDKPYHLGYYPQDEYAYRAYSGFEPCFLAVFRQKMSDRYGGLAKLNQAWGTHFTTLDAVDPPREFERSVRFADWQEFRQWAQMDFTRFVYETLKKADPKGQVIWSLPFWGSWREVPSWWSFAPYTDVLVRHGIGYKTGIYRLAMLRSVSAWCGKPANALCMPPDFNPTYVQMGFLLDGPKTGLSHVCTGGSPEHTYYQGAADSTDGYRRKEPVYTGSKSLNELVAGLGETWLLANHAKPRIGVFVSDRTVLLAGTDINALNGTLLILSDLNLDFELFAEPSLGDLSRFDAILAGQYSQCTSAEVAGKLAEFAHRGGLLILSDGALSADWHNLPLDGNPGGELAALTGSRESGRKTLTEPLQVVKKDGYPATLPVLGEASLRELDGAEVIAAAADGTPVVTRRRNVVFFGIDPGRVYQRPYTDDFAGVGEVEDKAVLDAFAGFDFDDTTGQLRAEGLQPHRAFARLYQALLAEKGIALAVTVDGAGRWLGAIRARALVRGSETVIGLANRVVNAGRDHRYDPAEVYHRPHRNLTVTSTAGPPVSYAVQWPMTHLNGAAAAALPTFLKHQGNSVLLPELVDVAAVLLTSDHQPVVGLAMDDRVLPQQSTAQVRVRVLNPSPRPVSGTVRLDAAAPLKAVGQPARVALAPGGQQEVALGLEVPLGTPPAYYLVQAVGELGAEPVTSPALEIDVPADLTLALPQLATSLYAGDGQRPTLRVTAATRTKLDLKLTASVAASRGFTVDAPSKPLAIPASGQQGAVEFTCSAAPGAPAEGTVTLTVSGDVRGQPLRETATFRILSGPATYRQTKSTRLGAAESSRRDLELVCLENRYLKATFYPNGLFHELFHRRTGTDCLGAGDYPFGSVWYSGGAAVTFDRFEHTPDRLLARFKGTLSGKPVTLQASLGRDERIVRLDWDCADAAAVSSSWYTMSRLSFAGEADLLTAPLKAGLLSLDWKRRTVRDLALADLTEPVLAVVNPADKETFLVAWRDLPFTQLRLMTKEASHNYMVFSTKEALAPKRFTLWLGVVDGDWPAALAASKKAMGGTP